MQIAFLKDELTYDGSQLQSHFAHGRLGILGDSAVAFMGACRVELDRMVDLEDVRLQAGIYSPKMLHFILEFFHLDLAGAVCFQRLCVAQIGEFLKDQDVSGLVRRGDDLYLAERKLNVSIATASPVSTLIHIGINIETAGTPVPTVGLQELNIDAKAFGEHFLEWVQKEITQIQQATYKVKAVP